MFERHRPPVLGFAAYSGTGKTSLLIRLIPLLRARGLRVGMVKHAHHNFEIDTPGKDSFELRKAGADQVLVASRRMWALIAEQVPEAEPGLGELLERIDGRRLDLILIEGFKHLSFPKIELHRPLLGRPLLFPDDGNVIAVACDGPLPTPTSLPVLNLNDPGEIASFIVDGFLTTSSARLETD